MPEYTEEQTSTLVSLGGFNDNVSAYNLMGVAPQRCLTCKRLKYRTDYSKPEGMLSGGRKGKFQWPDALSNTELIVSERAVSEFQDAGFAGFVATRFEFYEFKNKNLRPRDVPPYCYIDAKGRVPLSGRVGKLCPDCGMALKDATDPAIPNLKKWDGTDFSRFANILKIGVLVSGRVIDLIVEKEFTGFAIRAGNNFQRCGPVKIGKDDKDWRVSYNALINDTYASE